MERIAGALEQLKQPIFVGSMYQESENPPISQAKIADTSLIHDVSTVYQTEKVVVASPSKEELAKNWLKENPSGVKKSNRVLEKEAKPMGVTIGYQTWNRVKKDLKP